MGYFLFQLIEFLLHFVPYLFALFPVEADVADFVLNPVRLHQRGQRVGHAFQDSLISAFLLQLQFFPVLFYLASGLSLSLAKDMGMAIDELLAEAVAYVLDVERPLLLAYLGIEDDMQQEVSQLFLDVLIIFPHQGFAQFIRLLDGIRPQAFVRLLPVPRTFHSQFVKHVQQTAERLHLFFSCMHIHHSINLTVQSYGVSDKNRCP